MNYVFILGRQPKLSLAELESVYGAKNLTQISKDVAILDSETEPKIERLGGTQKIAKKIGVILGKSWDDAWPKIEKILLEKLKNNTSKCNVGMSVYGVKIAGKQLQNNMFGLKHALKKDYGVSVRTVGSGKIQLSSAQVLHNKLSLPPNTEVVVVYTKDSFTICQTIAIQDINSYSKRDHGRPQRDARVGMLPPKLAQIMINLAMPSDSKTPVTLLDPFCGTGVVLQEAVLLGLDVIGTDIEQRMAQYSAQNLHWLRGNYRFDGKLIYVKSADARNYIWDESVDVVVSETYLGPPLRHSPGINKLENIRNEVDQLLSKFLKNIHSQLKSGTRLCIAIPVWSTGRQAFHTKTVDHLESLGYTRLSFSHADSKDLIYRRFDQVVGRELLVLKKK